MSQRSRREFLADVGRGMLAGSLGVSLAAELGLGSVFAEDGADFPTFGKLEPLVALMQEAPLAKLQTIKNTPEKPRRLKNTPVSLRPQSSERE